MKIRKIKKEFKKGIRPIRKNRSYKVAKRLRKSYGTSSSHIIDYFQDIWQGKRFFTLAFNNKNWQKTTPRGLFFDQFATF